MRYVPGVSVLIIVCFAVGAYGADRSAVRAANRLAEEVQAKIISKTDADVKVRARDCSLHIEFQDNNVAFDLPLQGTRMAATDLEDGIILQNRNMTRKFADRTAEAFERLVLKFGRHNRGPVMEAFESAIKACGGGQAASVVAQAGRS